MTTELLERSFGVAAGVLANVKEDQLDDPTPCASWKVRDLINHLVGGSFFFAHVARTGRAEGAGEAPDFATADFNGAYAEGTKDAVNAFGAEGAMEKMMELPFGTMPGSAFIQIATTDSFMHAWDLAKATGQSTDLDPELAGRLLDGARLFISDAIRGPEPMPFSAAVDVPDDAPKADQLAGFLGRTP
jgi:uncharacterized protein (TIGR03086 family)